MKKQKKTAKKQPDSYAFIIDGETEKWYLQLLKQHESGLTMQFKPELYTKKSIEEQYKYLTDAAKSYTKVFWIVDLDVIIKETKEAKKGAKTPMTKLSESLDKLNRAQSKGKLKNIFVLINTPCLEYWILLHTKKTSVFYETCDPVVKEIQKHKDFKNYEKTEKYYKAANNDIYQKLKDFQQTALTNALALPKFDINNYKQGLAEMHILFKELGLCDDSFEFK